MKNLVSLVTVQVKENGFKNTYSFYQYNDDHTNKNEYRIYNYHTKETKEVTKEAGNAFYKEIIKNALKYIKVV